MAVEAAVFRGEEGLHDMVRQAVHVDRLVIHRAVARDRCAVGGQQRDLRRGDRLERFGKRRGKGQPDHGQDHQQKQPGCDPDAPVSGPVRGQDFVGKIPQRGSGAAILSKVGVVIVPGVVGHAIGKAVIAGMTGTATGSFMP